MKNRNSFSFLAASIIFSAFSAQASILSPNDIVIYNEKEPQNNLISIQKLANGDEWITQASCDKDMWIGDSASEAAHCHTAIPILPVSEFSRLVEKVVVEVSTSNPGTSLAPLPPADLDTYLRSLKIQADPANLSAIQKLSSLKVELKNAADMLAHLPDNPDYLDRKKTAETEIAKLAGLNQEISEAQSQAAKVKKELAELSESMLELIRHKKLKNTQLPFSAANPETDEPNSLGKSQMNGTLLKAVLEHLSGPSGNESTLLNGDHYQLGTDSSNNIAVLMNSTPSNRNQVLNFNSDVKNPYLYTDGQAVFIFIQFRSSLTIYRYGMPSGEVDNQLPAFYKILNVTSETNGAMVTAMTTDGKIWQKQFSSAELVNGSTATWTEIK